MKNNRSNLPKCGWTCTQGTAPLNKLVNDDGSRRHRGVIDDKKTCGNDKAAADDSGNIDGGSPCSAPVQRKRQS